MQFSNRRVLRAFASVFVLAIASAAGAATDWPQWRGPQRDGTGSADGLATDWRKTPPRVIWTAKIGTGFSSIAISDGIALTLGNKDNTDTVFAFDAGSGKLKWKHSYPCDLDPLRHEGGPFATPTVVGKRVYTLSKLGQLFCLELATGKVVWKVDLVQATGSQRETYGFSGSPLVVGDRVIVSAGSGGAGFDAATGKLVWKSKPHVKPGHASPVLITVAKDKKPGVLVMGKTLMSIVNPSDGRLIAQQTLVGQGSRIYKIPDPLIIGDSIFVTSTYGYVCTRIKLSDGKFSEMWRNKNLTSKMLSPVLIDGHIVGGHLERWFRCIDPATGEIKWEDKGFAGNVIRAGKLSLILTTTGDLILADISARGFKELGRAKALNGKCWTMPALAGGKVYCRNADGDLACIDVGERN